MLVVRLCAVSCLLCLIVAVSLSGQQKPAPSATGAPQAAASRATEQLARVGSSGSDPHSASRGSPGKGGSGFRAGGVQASAAASSSMSAG